MITISPGREKDLPTVLTAGAHDFALFQEIYKVVHLSDGGKANRPKFFKPIIYLFLLTHLFISQEW
jgi:hypothetical protein